MKPQTITEGDADQEARVDQLLTDPSQALPPQEPRQGWEEQFRAMSANGDDQLLDADLVVASSWDETEWEW